MRVEKATSWGVNSTIVRFLIDLRLKSSIDPRSANVHMLGTNTSGSCRKEYPKRLTLFLNLLIWVCYPFELKLEIERRGS